MAKWDANKLKTAEQKAAEQTDMDRRQMMRDRVRSKGRPQAFQKFTLDLGDGGEPIKLDARGVSGEVKWLIQSTGFETKTKKDGTPVLDEKGKPVDDIVSSEFYPPLIAGTFYFEDSTEQFWPSTEEGFQDIRALDIAVLNQLTKVALKLAGWAKEARDEMEGNSDAGEATGDSSTTSPTEPASPSSAS